MNKTFRFVSSQFQGWGRRYQRNFKRSSWEEFRKKQRNIWG